MFDQKKINWHEPCDSGNRGGLARQKTKEALMKSYRSLNLLAVTTAVILTLALASPGIAQQRRASGRAGAGNGSCDGGINSLFSEIEKGTLSTDEIDGLILMREEEKLARDVYLTLGEKWQLPIFGNIAGAEQRHMDAVQMVFTTYENEINDPGFDNTVGTFANSELADLYLQLVEKGNLSLVDALTVGAIVEDLDLKDLEDLLGADGNDNDHVRLVYNNLAKGSRNHLRAFMRALTAQGGTYSPDHIDQETFDAILGSEMERRVVYGADGEVLATGCGGRGGQGRRGQGQGQGRGNRGGSGSGTGECDGSGPQGGGQAAGANS
jgi:hypothetical protein